MYVCKDNKEGRPLWLSQVQKRKLDNKKKDKRMGKASNVDTASILLGPVLRECVVLQG